MHCYARLLANHPFVVLAVVGVLVGTCLVVSITMTDLPSFQDPRLGFEPRGTVLSNRKTAWDNLMKATANTGPLITNPNAAMYRRTLLPIFGNSTIHTHVQPAHVTENDTGLNSLPMFQVSLVNATAVDQNGKNLTVLTRPKADAGEGDNRWGQVAKTGLPAQRFNLPINTSSTDSFFCGEPLDGYARVVFSAVDGGNLMTAAALRSMCSIDDGILRKGQHFGELCERTPRGARNCCPSWSVGNYVALLNNRTCDTLRDEDVNATLHLLETCVPYYNQLRLRDSCVVEGEWEPSLCPGVPLACVRHNAVYNILYYLADVKFLNTFEDASNRVADSEPNKLHLALVFLPIAQSSAALPFFKSLEGLKLGDGVTEVVAMQMGLKYLLFDEYLVTDTAYLGVAAGVILLLMWMYTASLLITVFTVVAIVFSLIIAYCIYSLVFDIRFFPFMNLLTCVIVIGIGADDAFIYCKVWACAKSERNNGTLVKLVNDTLRHASLSMFVTSLTTAAAFFASCVSSITAIRCFSIFAGTTVLANFLLMVTWLPATVVVAERWCSSNWCICIPPFGLYAPQLHQFTYCSKFCGLLWRLHYRFTEWARVFFEKILPCVVIKPRWIWVFSLGASAVLGAAAILYKPKLQLPDSEEFQIFPSDHLFERYDIVFKEQFSFEKMKKTVLHSKIPLRFVWGVKPVDNGDYLNPYSKGELVLDETFNVAAPASQEWLLGFCHRLRGQPFYQSTLGLLLPNCFIETFKEWMSRQCSDPFSPVGTFHHEPCCETSEFPYSEKVFNKCIKVLMKSLFDTPLYYLPGVAGPHFSRRNGKLQAAVVEYDSVQSFTFSYPEMKRFFVQVETWVKAEMAMAPPGMKNGWFISALENFDLQESLAGGTAVAIGVAIAVASVVLFITTLNVLVTMFAVLTIACIIFVTVGLLVLLGWKLDVLESVTVSVAIGLAVDFTLHYGVVYRLSAEEDRETAVILSLAKMGSPIAMAAFTTFLAGAAMLPSKVLGYMQIGTFIMIVMTASWIYSTLFFQALLRLWGPQRHFGQFRYPSANTCKTCCLCMCRNELQSHSNSTNAHTDKMVYSFALSESTLSTSSTGYPLQGNASESHELEPLTVQVPNLSGNSQPQPHRYVKRKGHSNSTSRANSSSASRQRSGSLSVVSNDKDPAMAALVVRPSRKVSLPTTASADVGFQVSGNVLVASDPSPRHVSGATSSTTIVFSDEEPLQGANRTI